MSGQRSSKRRRNLLLAGCLAALTTCLFLSVQQIDASAQGDGDYTLVIEFESEIEGVSTKRYYVPLYVEGTSVSGDYTSEARQGHEVIVFTFRGSLRGDILRGDISYELTGSTAGYESSWTYSFYEPGLEFSVTEGGYTRILVETSVRIEERGEYAPAPYTEPLRFYATVYPSAVDDDTAETDGDENQVPSDDEGDIEDTGDGTDVTEGEGEAPLLPGGFREIGDIPGPASWPQAATGILFPGLLGLFISLFANLFKGGAPPLETIPVGPTVPTGPQPPGAYPLEDLSPDAGRPAAGLGEHDAHGTDTALRDIISRMRGETLATAGDGWKRYCDDRFRRIEGWDKVETDGMIPYVKDFAVVAGKSVWDTGVAVKDGVVGFVEGVVNMPVILATESWKLWERRSGLLGDLMDPEIIKQTGVNIYETVGKELLPIDEIRCFFESDATLEERLWAFPSAVLKVANIVLMSPRIAATPVRGIPKDLTLIKSAKPVNQAVEAAKAGVPAEAQAEYEAYKAAAAEKASGITKTVEEGGVIAREQVLDAMTDPAAMRQLKDAPAAVQSKFFATQAREVYSPVYRDVIEFMEAKYPGAEFRVKSVRTPGQKKLINTDNDVIMQRKVTTKDGKVYWEEVPVKEWSGRYNESFSQQTGFSLDDAKARFPEENWDAMTPQQRHQTWAERFGQETMDVTQPEAARAFSDQPTAMRPDWEPGAKSPVSEGTMVDPEGLGLMERHKTTRGWQEGTVRTRTEGMEQGAKAGKLSRRLTAQSQARTGYQYSYPKLFEQGLEVVNMRELAPAVRDAALKNLGFQGGYVEFMDKLSNWMGGLR